MRHLQIINSVQFYLYYNSYSKLVDNYSHQVLPIDKYSYL